MNVREAAEADLPRLIELLLQLSQLGEIPERAKHRPGAAEHDALKAIASDPRCSLLVLEIDGRIEATLTLYLMPNLSHGGRPFGIVESVVVDERRRGTGCGQLLMEEAEARARAAGCYKIALTSNRKRSDAHRFYQRLGYRATHEGFTKYFDLVPGPS